MIHRHSTCNRMMLLCQSSCQIPKPTHIHDQSQMRSLSIQSQLQRNPAWVISCGQNRWVGEDVLVIYQSIICCNDLGAPLPWDLMVRVFLDCLYPCPLILFWWWWACKPLDGYSSGYYGGYSARYLHLFDFRFSAQLGSIKQNWHVDRSDQTTCWYVHQNLRRERITSVE